MSRPDADGRRGTTALLAATVIAGGCGYLITWLVPRSLGFAPYAEFAVFWSLLFFLVAVLSGIQQEASRAAFPAASDSAAPGRARPFVAASAAAGAAVVLALASSPLWAAVAFARDPLLAIPVAIGVGGYVFVAVSNGILYGLERWRAVVSLMLAEALVRVALVVAALVLGGGVVAAAWATAVASGIAVLANLGPVRRAARVVGLDVTYGALAANAARTIVASASLGVMVTGLPVLMSAVGRDEPARLGTLIVIVTFSRAPIVVVLMALQSLLIVRMRTADPLRLVARLVALVAAGGAVLCVAGVLAGPPLFALLFARASGFEPWIYAVMVGSSAIIGICTIVGSATLARGRHRAYAIGWALGAVSTVGSFLLPGGLMIDTVVACTVPPVIAAAALAVGALRRSPR